MTSLHVRIRLTGTIYSNLFEYYIEHELRWEDFLHHIDKHIINIECKGLHDTVVEFASEAHKNWFLLKWS